MVAGTANGTGGMSTGGTGGAAGAESAGSAGVGGLGGAGGAGPAGGGAAGIGGVAGSSGKGGAGSSGKGGAGSSGKGGAGAGGASGNGGFAGSESWVACDPTKGKDFCPAGQKCSVIAGGSQPGCNPPLAGGAFTLGEGQDCKRDVLGVDTCQEGFLCTIRGVLDSDSMNQHTQCKKWCTSDAGCGPSQVCNAFTADMSGQPDGVFGLCVDVCEPFTPCLPLGSGAGGAGSGGAGGSPTAYTCADPVQDNDLAHVFFACHAVGPGDPGSLCVNGKDCAANELCGGPFNGPVSGVSLCIELCRIMDPSGLPDHDCTKKGQSCASMGLGVDICQ
jgi:hypothetical protein